MAPRSNAVTTQPWSTCTGSRPETPDRTGTSRLSDGSRYVVRIEQGGVFGTSSAEEFEFMRGGPRRWAARWRRSDGSSRTGDVLGQPFFVMDYRRRRRRTSRDDRSLAPELADRFRAPARPTCTAPTGRRTIARRRRHRGDATHAADRPVARRLPGGDRRSPSRCSRRARPGCTITHPTLERVGIVHGDPGPGNFVHDGRA